MVIFNYKYSMFAGVYPIDMGISGHREANDKVEILEKEHTLTSLAGRARTRRTGLNEREDRVVDIRLPGLRCAVRFYWVARKRHDRYAIRLEKAGWKDE